ADATAGEAPLNEVDLAVNGNDVMKILGIPPGPEVGAVLRELLEIVLDDPSKNRREYLIDILPGLHRSLTRNSRA
ncbi:MAG TPA: polynucleotide adenylyltransferase, partial [Clostridia bacterium]|nr:polynucleotide adenylyltransferase [Clostridia bacterium]